MQTKGLKLPSKALIIFGPSHVRVYELDGTTLLEEWEYSSISSFTRMADGWVIVVGDLFKPEVYTFQSPWVRARSLFRARFITIIIISPLVVVIIRRRRSTRCTSASWPRPSGRHKRGTEREPPRIEIFKLRPSRDLSPPLSPPTHGQVAFPFTVAGQYY